MRDDPWAFIPVILVRTSLLVDSCRGCRGAGFSYCLVAERLLPDVFLLLTDLFSSPCQARPPPGITGAEGVALMGNGRYLLGSRRGHGDLLTVLRSFLSAGFTLLVGCISTRQPNHTTYSAVGQVGVDALPEH